MQLAKTGIYEYTKRDFKSLKVKGEIRLYSVIEHLYAAAKLHPKKSAYIRGTDSLSFEELTSYAESAASMIINTEMPGRPVAVLASRSFLTPACFLGIAMAGCFYAPMDPDAPDARLRQILDVVKADTLMVDKAHLDRLEPLGFKGNIILMEDAVSTDIDRDAISRSLENITDDSPIYVLFTSGSTGVPKGVLNSHRAVLCYLDGLNNVIGLNDTDIIGNQAPFDYIAAIRDLYLPLVTGATTVMLDPSEFAMPKRLIAKLGEAGVTTLCWSSTGLEIPAKLGAFDPDEGDEEIKLPPLKRVVYSGSVISNPLLRKWQDAFPDTVFINQYGPTEATGSCSYYIIDHPVEADEVISIGRPYKHYQMMLLDADDKEPALGDTGEICIKGPALALGYYDAPEQTASCFMDNPLETHYRERIYRTGDIGRIDADGNYYFLGRKDRQFKHLGHRIEPEELEQKTMLIDGITACMCVYNEKEKNIYLFYSGTADKKGIALALREELPSYMVPRKIVCLDEMPRLPNGKIDKKAVEAMAVK